MIMPIDAPPSALAAAKAYATAVKNHPDLLHLDVDGQLASAIQLVILAFQKQEAASTSDILNAMSATLAYLLTDQPPEARQLIMQTIVHQAFAMADTANPLSGEVAGHA